MRNDVKTERYILLEDIVTLEEDTYRTYGIADVRSDNDCREEYHDLSTERAAVSALVDMCNELRLETLHLKDVVEDFLISE